MDNLQFIGSFTASVYSNDASQPVRYRSECPRDEYDDIFLVFLVFVALCAYLIILGIEILFEEEEKKIVEIAPNPHADFLERIDFAGVVPPEFVCPITQCIMQDPVRIRGGHEAHVFERTAFEKWINEGSRINPLNRQPLSRWTRLASANDVSKKIKMWMSDLRLRRHAFSIWSRGKIAEEQARLNVACLSASR